MLFGSHDLGVDARPLPSAQSDHIVSVGFDSTYAVLDRADRFGPDLPESKTVTASRTHGTTLLT